LALQNCSCDRTSFGGRARALYFPFYIWHWQYGLNIAKVSYGARAALTSGFALHRDGVKSLKNQLYGFVSLSCVEEVMGPNSVQPHGMLSLCLIGKLTPCEHVALHNSFAILGPCCTLMRHHGGNTLQSQDHHEGLRALLLKAMECAFF
jgi:hypothetical protein